MKHFANLLILWLLLPVAAIAQTFKYIGVENGLSNRRIFHIQKDSIGYMWFLTNEGLDRYNGKEVKHYNFVEEEGEYAYPLHLGWLYMDKEGGLWALGKKGRIFSYDSRQDKFALAYKLPTTPAAVSLGYLDSNGLIWLCCRTSIALFDTWQ